MFTQKKIVQMMRCLLLVMVIVLIPIIALAGIEVVQAKATVIKLVDENTAHISDIARKIGEYAEIGLKEFKSSDLLVSELEANGFKIEQGLVGMPTSFVGTYKRGTGQPVIGILAEFDALPQDIAVVITCSVRGVWLLRSRRR